MRSTIIPAQITTVEDKIAGSLTISQILILLVPVFFGTLVFAVLPPTMHVALYKLPPVLLVLFISLLLSLRIKGRVVASWVFVLLSFNLRPKYYVFNKNESYLRDLVDIKTLHTEKTNAVVKKEHSVLATKFGLKELKEFETFIKNPNYSFRLKPGKKGGLYVAISEIQK